MSTPSPSVESNNDDDIEFNFIPSIEVNDVVNGIIELQVTNILNLWENNQFGSMEDVCFKIVFRINNVNQNDDDDMHDNNIWKEKQILVGSVGDNGKMYLKTNVYLYQYEFEFYLKTMNVKTKKWMNKNSDIIKICIPSFLVDNDFKIGQEISYRAIDTFHTNYGKIVEILKDNFYKIKYFKYDDKKKGPRAYASSYIETTSNIHISRLYHQSTNEQFEIDLTSKKNLNKNLLAQTNDKHKLLIFNSIFNSLKPYSQNESCNIYGFEKAIINWKSMNTFITRNIFKYLYKSSFEYHVSCLIEGDKHNNLNMINLRQSDIRTKMYLMKNKIGNIIYKISMFNNTNYSCDWCRGSINEWDFVFQCINSKYIDRHDFCINCVNTIITLNKQLKNLLNKLLSKQLIIDCIQLIVHFVIGKVIYTQFQIESTQKNNNKKNKRKTMSDNDIMLIPRNAKRRRLDLCQLSQL